MASSTPPSPLAPAPSPLDAHTRPSAPLPPTPPPPGLTGTYMPPPPSPRRPRSASVSNSSATPPLGRDFRPADALQFSALDLDFSLKPSLFPSTSSMSLSSASASASFATAPASKPSISGLNPAHDRDAEKGEDGEREVDVIRVVSSHGARDDRREEAEGKQDDGAGGPPPPPDGGTRAWMTVAGAWLVQFSTFGYISSFGVYQDYYATYYLPAETSSNISWIGSLQLCLMYAPGVFVGRAFDAGYFHHLEVLGALLYVFSIFMLSLARPGDYYQVFLAQAVGMGLGLGLTFLPSLSVVGHHFRTRRALAVGVAISGSSAGGIVFPIMLNRLLQDPSVGFANAVRASGAVVGGCLVVANCLMRTRLPPKRGDVHQKGGSKRAARIETWRGMVWDGAYLWSVCGAFLTSLGIYVPLFYLQLFAVDHGVSSHITTYSLAILNAGSTLGRLLPTFLADKVGVYNMLVPAMVACAGLIFAIFGATNGPGVVLVGSIFGFVSGAYISLIPTLLVQLCRNMGELGVKMGLAYSVVAAANLIGNPIAGALLGTNTGGPLTWWRALVFTGCVAAAGSACMGVSRSLFIKGRGRPGRKV